MFECSRREVFEETGLRIKNLRIKAVGNAYLKDLNQEFYFHFIFADYAGGKLNSKNDDGTLRWLTVKEIKELPNLLAEIHEIVSFIFNDYSNIVSYKAVYSKGNKLDYFKIESGT